MWRADPVLAALKGWWSSPALADLFASASGDLLARAFLPILRAARFLPGVCYLLPFVLPGFAQAGLPTGPEGHI